MGNLESITRSENTEEYYGGTFIYLNSSAMDRALSQIKPIVDNSVFTLNRAQMIGSKAFEYGDINSISWHKPH